MRPLLLACSLLILSSCGPEPTMAAPEKVPAPKQFARFVDKHFDAWFANRPTSATRAGLHQHDGELEDMSRAHLEARAKGLETELNELHAIEREELSFDDQIDYEALDRSIQAEHASLTSSREWEHNPMLYASLPGRAVDSIMKREFAPGADRVRSVTARLRAVPALFAAARANLRDIPPVFAELGLRLARGNAKFLERDVPAWAEKANGGSLPADFVAADAQATAAAKSFAGWLEIEVVPVAKGDFALGEAKFAEKVRLEEHVELPLDQLLSIGEGQLARDYAKFVSTALGIDANKEPAQVMKSLSAQHPSEDDLVAKVAASVEDARKFVVEKQLATLPSEVRPTVAETPPFARAATFASMDTPGPFETKATEAYYYVTPVEKDWDDQHKEQHLRMFNPWVVAMIDVHEAFPGHYLQFLWAKKFPSKVRKLVYAASNGEGWAHYVEQMMVDEGFGGGDPRMRLAQLQEALLRDCRYVAAIKLHTMGWTVAQAAKLFEEKAFQEPANALEEAKRGTYNPTYLAYTMGKLAIQALEKEVREKKKLSLREFHDAFVSQGALPIPLVRKIMLRE